MIVPGSKTGIHSQFYRDRSLSSQSICNDSANERNANLFASFTANAAYLRNQVAMIAPGSKTIHSFTAAYFAIKMQKYTFFLK